MAFLSTSWFRTISKFPSSASLLRGSSPGGRSPSGRRAARPSFTGGLFCCRCGRFRALVQTPSKRDRIPCGIPPLTGSDRQTGYFHFGNNHRSLPGLGPRWSVRKPDKKAAIVAGAVGTGLAALVAPQGPRTSRAHPEQQTRPSPRFKLLRAASIGEAAFLFPSAPAPRGEPGKSR